MTGQLHSPAALPRYPLNTRLSGPRGQSLVSAGIRTPDRPAPCLIILPILSIPTNINNHENQTTAAAAVAMYNV